MAEDKMDTDWELEVWFKGDREKAIRIKKKVKDALAGESEITDINMGHWD